MSTEGRNERTVDIDLIPTEDAVRALLFEDELGVRAVMRSGHLIARAVELCLRQIDQGGAVSYFGAGASGRIAVLDATELGPTFGSPKELVQAHYPGGLSSLVDSTLDLEDSYDLGFEDAKQLRELDVAFGITASGRTPYVAGALARAREKGATTILLTCSEQGGIDADLVISIPTGPEAITGSTRLKAGTATKCALNAFSTSLMVSLGRTYSNWMTGVTVTNAKLQERAVRIVESITGHDSLRARSVLEDSGWRTDLAIVSLKTGCSIHEAERALVAHHTVRRAITELDTAE